MVKPSFFIRIYIAQTRYKLALGSIWNSIVDIFSLWTSITRAPFIKLFLLSKEVVAAQELASLYTLVNWEEAGFFKF